jgi:hypothetical protein
VAIAKTTDDLLTDVRARVVAPSANGLLSSTEILALADQEMRTELAAILIGIRSEYWLANYTTSITSGTASYRMPDRALGMALRDVTVYDSNGREYDCVNIPADQRYLWTRGQTWAPTGPFAFTLDNGAVVLLPTPSSSGWTLRMRYYASPSRLVATSEAMAIETPLDADTLRVTEPVVSKITTSGAYVDVVRGAGMFDVIFENITVLYTSGAGSGELDLYETFDEDDVSDSVPTNARVDYVCASGETVYPPIPESMWPLLVALTCRAYCEAVGDMRGLEAAAAMYERKKAAALAIMQPRVDGEVQRPMPIFSPLRGGRYGGRNG